MTWIPIVLFVGFLIIVWYFLMIRPIRHREQQHDRLVLDLAKGDIVITAGGMYGKVDQIDEGSVVIIVESGTKIRVTKGSILKIEGPPREIIG
ncbi:MAG: preprotein translocase subunit YajC [Dehalococcoidales bacterium]|nr:preprotein translocase subunit YajC [Dehalococcoidales bacterium]